MQTARSRSPMPLAVPAVVLLALIAAGAGWWLMPQTTLSHAAPQSGGSAGKPPAAAAAAADAAPNAEEHSQDRLEFSQESWQAAGLEMQPVATAPLPESVSLTGKITLNEDHLSHIFPLVEGRVDEVQIRFGDKVRQGQPLVIVSSKEVGQGMLHLYQDRLERDVAKIKDEWTQEITKNTLALLETIRKEPTIEEIEVDFRDRPMGDYRNEVMTAYIAKANARRNLDRLKPLADGGAVSGRQILEAEAEWNRARATLQSILEQTQHELKHQAILSTQALRELQTRVAVDETRMKILGFGDADLASINPDTQQEAISHYPIVAPFDGTVITKDVTVLERVGPDKQILTVADLSTVWVTADIFEGDLGKLGPLAGREIQLQATAWPGKTFDAEIFYTGDLVNESSRTVSLRAVADNPDGLLKPGMFVNILLNLEGKGSVMQVPLSAVMEHEGAKFVFVHTSGDAFERRDLTLGRANGNAVEVLSGLSTGDEVVTAGGFALKSRMLAGLLEE